MTRMVCSDNKEQRKKLRNRESAQRARDRQKARMRWLENEVAVMRMRNEALLQENVFLKHFLLARGFPTVKDFKFDGKEAAAVVNRLYDVNNDCSTHTHDVNASNLSQTTRTPDALETNNRAETSAEVT